MGGEKQDRRARARRDFNAFGPNDDLFKHQRLEKISRPVMYCLSHCLAV